MSSGLIFTADTMNLQSYETMRSPLIHKIGTWNTVQPCSYAISDSLYTRMIPFSVPECILGSLVFDRIKPSVTSLVIDSGRPCPWRRIDLELIAMHSAIAIFRNAGRTELHSRIKRIINLEIKFKDEIRKIFIEGKECIRSIQLGGSDNYSILDDILGISVQTGPPFQVLSIEDITPVCLSRCTYSD